MPRQPRVANPPQRLLRVYAFDPSRGTRFENYLTIRVPFEPLVKGPVGRKIAVIDFDASNQCYYESVDLQSTAILGQNGLAPSETNPQFHQQMAYAVVMDTIRRFEVALGREIHWRPDRGAKTDPYHGLLKVYPHALQEANAYYDADLHALVFGYFRAEGEDVGPNLPGQTVFTCLSHDIVVHETTHAILDGIREHFIEPTGLDAAAFHEGFADIVALLQHFSFKESLLDTIQRTGGLIHRPQLAPDVAAPRSGAMIQAELGEDNPLVDLARQFGEAMGYRKALRSALGTPPDPRALEKATEAHDRGAILVAAVFDAFFSIYVKRTRDLVRIAYPDGRDAVPNFLHADLANRLAGEAAATAARLQNICLRAIDYCPPVDITFGDYLRAVVTADRDNQGEDDFGYRAALIAGFRSRGIRPEGVFSYDEDALSWDIYAGPTESESGMTPDFKRLWSDLERLEDNPDADRQPLYERLWGKADTFRRALGLSDRAAVQAKSINTLRRLRPDGSLNSQIVAELVQQLPMPIDPANPTGEMFTFRGGTTLIINRQGEVRYSVAKPLDGPAADARLARQREYLTRMADAFALAPYVQFDHTKDCGFRSIHRGY